MYLPAIDNDASDLIDYPQLTGTPERRLLLAILERAILDFVGNDLQEVHSAEAWLFDEEASISDRFSFPWICHELDLEEGHISGLIRKMPRRGKNRVAPWYFARHSFLQNTDKKRKLLG